MDEIGMEKRLTAIESTQNKHTKDIADIQHRMGGNNSHVGLVAQVLLNTKAIEVMQKSEEKRHEYWQKISLLIIGAVVTNVIAIIAAAVTIAYLTP